MAISTARFARPSRDLRLLPRGVSGADALRDGFGGFDQDIHARICKNLVLQILDDRVGNRWSVGVENDDVRPLRAVAPEGIGYST